MNAAELLLDLAGFALGVETYPAVSYNPTSRTFIAGGLSGRSGEYSNGLLWFAQGVDWNVRSIERADGDRVVIDRPLLEDFTPDEITLSDGRDFQAGAFLNALNAALANYPVMDTDDTLRTAADVIHYDLPAAVSDDIRRVEIVNKFRLITNHHWLVQGRQLTIEDARYYPDGAPVFLRYVRPHGRVGYDDPVSRQVHLEYVRYTAYCNLYRSEIQSKHKDNSIAIDLFNEAKAYEKELRDAQIPGSRLLRKDMSYPFYE